MKDTAHRPAFGALLSQHRRATGLTQEELAERAGISLRSIGDMERGVPHTPRNETLARLVAALALGPDEGRAFTIAGREAALAHARPAPQHPTAPPLVGRARELALLERHLSGDGPPVLLLAGEPGIGKTRLLRAASAHAGTRGWRVLEAGCQRSSGQEPYAPLPAALRRELRGQRPVHLRASLHGCAWLVRLLPDVAAAPIPPLPPWTLTPAQEHPLMVEAVVRFLTNIAGPRGTVLVLDDLQWAGPDALDLITTLARSAGEAPLRLVGAYRDTEVRAADPLSTMLADLVHAGLAARCRVGPLAPEEAAQLLDDLLAGSAAWEPGVRDGILRRTGGVPFFLMSCAQGVLHQGLGERAEAVPWDVAHSVSQRIAALPGPSRQVLGMAAVLGRVVPRTLLTVLAGLPEDALLATLDALCQARLLEEQGAEAYRCAHDIIREVVEADLGAVQRAVLHRRVATALEQQEGAPPIERLAYHFSRGGVPEKAVLYLEQAGDRARTQYATAAAASYYQDLLALLDSLGRVGQTAAVREKLGEVLYTSGQFDAALEAYERAIETYRQCGDTESQARVTAQVGRVHAAWNIPHKAATRLQAFLATLGSREPSAGQAGLYAALAWLYLASCRGEEKECVEAAERAAELARAVGDDAILADAEVLRGCARLYLGQTADALRVLEDALPRAEVAGHLNALFRALHHIGTIHIHTGAFAQAGEYLARALELAERIGGQVERVAALSHRCDVLFVQGEWQAAGRDLARTVDLERNLPGPVHRGHTVLRLARLYLAQGNWAAAARSAEECLPWAERTGDLPDVQGLLAEHDLLEGRADAALARLTPLLDHPGTAEIERTLLLPLVAWAHLERGETAAAAEVLARGIRQALAQNHRLALVDMLRMQARVAIRQGRWAEAEHTLEESLALARGMPYPYAEARLLQVSGELHMQKGEPEAARERLAAALALYQRLGARADSERLQQTIAMLEHV